VPVFEFDHPEVGVDPDDLAAPAGGDVLDDESWLSGLFDRATAGRTLPIAGKDVALITV